MPKTDDGVVEYELLGKADDVTDLSAHSPAATEKPYNPKQFSLPLFKKATRICPITLLVIYLAFVVTLLAVMIGLIHSDTQYPVGIVISPFPSLGNDTVQPCYYPPVTSNITNTIGCTNSNGNGTFYCYFLFFKFSHSNS